MTIARTSGSPSGTGEVADGPAGAATSAGSQPPAPVPTAERRGLSRVAIVVTALAGLGLRIVLMTSTASFGRPDSDEVIAGLMARRIGTDGYPWFFWGQHYGGTPSLWLDAASLRVFGSSVVAMRIPTVLFAVGCSLLVWRVAARLLSPRAAQLAGLLAWVGGPPAVFFSTRDHLFYVPTVLCGLLAALFALRIRDGDGDRRRVDLSRMNRSRTNASRMSASRIGASWMNRPWTNWSGLVTALVVGVWCMPTIVYFAVPAVFVIAYEPLRQRVALRASTAAPPGRRRSLIGPGILAAAALAVVASVAFVWFTKAAPPAWHGARFDYVSNFTFFFTDGLPGLLGFREMFTYRWIFGPVGVVGYLAVLSVIGIGLVTAVRRRAWDAVGLCVFPFVFALFPQATEQPNMRYMFFVVPFVAVLAARAATQRQWTAYLAIVVALGLTVTSLHRLYVVSEVDRSTRVGLVGDVDQAIAVLDEHRIDGVYANYWIAYRITFESGERIIATPPFREERYHPYAAEVAKRPRNAWVVSRGQQLDALRTSFGRLGVSTTERDAGEFVVVLPDRVVPPEELGDPVRGTV